MNKNFEIEISGLGMNNTGYPGAFTPTVNNIIQEIQNSLYQTLASYSEPKMVQILHLFSGVSKIGDVRVDIERPEATDNIDVLDFIQSDTRHWDLVILDPPYEIKTTSKLSEYGKTSSVAANVPLRTALVQYFIKHCDNVVWLDMCAPLFEGFNREKLWFLFPGGYRTVRILSWLKRR